MLTRREALALPLASLVSGGLHPRLAFGLDDDPTKVFTGGRKPTDVRLGPPKTLNGYFPFVVPKTKEEWDTRRKQLREQLLVATGLWPMPEKTPLNAVVHGKIERDGYTIEKVFFASMPGHYVSGNLYRPTAPAPSGPAGGKPGAEPSAREKRPGVLFAHGHWANGRLHDAGEKAAAESVKAGGESDPERGRFFMQAIPVTLARMGFVVFQYDMVGVGDSTAMPHPNPQNRIPLTADNPVDAELRAQSFMGLQTWNSIRSLDFLAGLPGVDAARLGMTGASGGGTQTFMLAALDDRLAAAFPAVMVSTAMQGGCVCENCSLLRVNTGNVEIAALFAPKPLAFSAANDWTKDFMTKGFPELKQLYTLLGAPDNVAAKAWLEYGHQYNQHAREFMYSWFSKHLLGKDGPVKEAPYRPVPPKELSVYNAEHPRPKDELNAEKLREAMTKASDAQMKALEPTDAKTLTEYKRVVGTALRAEVVDEVPKEIAIREGPHESNPDGLTLRRAVLGRTNEDDAMPAVGAYGPAFKRDRAVIWVHPKGKASLFENGKAVPAFRSLVDAGFAVASGDLFGTGESAPAKPFPVDKDFAGYTYGYNRSVLANRVHDVLTLVGLCRSVFRAKTIHLVGWGEMGPVAVLAKALAGDAVAKTAADLNQFRFETIKDVADPMMLPGAVKYGGLGAFLALCASGEVLAHNHKGTATGRVAKAAYDAAGAADKLTRVEEKLDDLKVVEWLLK